MSTSLWSDEAEHAAIVSAALALIDEVYPPHSHRTTTKLRAEIQQLRDEIAALERILSQTQLPLDGSSLTALWADMADRQRHLRQEAVGENAVLRESVQSQLALIAQFQRTLEPILLKMRPVMASETPLPIPRWPNWMSWTHDMLTQRLETIAEVASGEWIGLFPSIGVEFRDRQASPTSPGNGLKLQYRYAGYVPFKLSLVATELWDMLLHESFGHEASYTISDQSPHEAFGQHVLNWTQPPSVNLHVRGPSGIRRVFTADGSVVFAAASIACGSHDSPSTNLLEGCDVHEASWLRIGHAPMAPSLVYIESMCYLDVKPTHRHPWQLERVRDTMLHASERIGKSNVQKLENRLLDAAIASGNVHLTGGVLQV